MKYIYILLISISCLVLTGCGGGGGGDNGIVLTPQQQEFADVVYAFATAVNDKDKAKAMNLVSTDLVYNNQYDCVVDARFILSGKTEPYLIIRVFFLEFSSSRFFTVKLGKDMNQISVECSENPGIDFVNSLIQVQDEATKAFINNAMNNISQDYVVGKIRNIFSPIFIAVHNTQVTKKS